MIIFSRIICYIVIFQLLALSSLPAAISLGYTGQFTKFIQTSDTVYDHQVIPENHDHHGNNEILLKWEEENEDEDHLSDFFNAFVSFDAKIFVGYQGYIGCSNLFNAFKTIALFILFHCWKIDFL